MKRGFTLAELLIALAILGVIATFTIPKVLNGQQSQKYNAMAKEAVSAFSEALAKHRYNGLLTSATTTDDLKTYFNYIKVDTVSTIDEVNLGTSLSCATDGTCLLLANGGVLFYYPLTSFGGTSSTNAIWFYFDPDGKYGGSTTGASKSVAFWGYYSGRITTYSGIEPNTNGLYNPNSNYDPSWFSWDN